MHIVVPKGAKYVPLSGVVVHESRRFRAENVRSYDGIPCVEAGVAAIDAAAWQRWPRFAIALLAAVVQQRICTATHLRRQLDTVGQVRHRKQMRLALADIAGGAESLGEIDMARVCSRYGLQPPDRQRLRRDPTGRRRYLDCEWTILNGSIVVLEIDGSHHLLVEHWEADLRRERSVVASGRWVLRATAAEIRLDPGSVVADLKALGVPTCPNVMRP